MKTVISIFAISLLPSCVLTMPTAALPDPVTGCNEILDMQCEQEARCNGGDDPAEALKRCRIFMVEGPSLGLNEPLNIRAGCEYVISLPTDYRTCIEGLEDTCAVPTACDGMKAEVDQWVLKRFN